MKQLSKRTGAPPCRTNKLVRLNMVWKLLKKKQKQAMVNEISTWLKLWTILHSTHKKSAAKRLPALCGRAIEAITHVHWNTSHFFQEKKHTHERQPTGRVNETGNTIVTINSFGNIWKNDTPSAHRCWILGYSVFDEVCGSLVLIKPIQQWRPVTWPMILRTLERRPALTAGCGRFGL